MIHRTLAAAAATLMFVATSLAGFQIGDARRVLLGAPAVCANNSKSVRVDADIELGGVSGYLALA